MSACKGCGARIVWGLMPDGKKIPLDPKPPIYIVDEDRGTCRRLSQDFMVSHFATCPNANDFSGKGKK